ncbi:hypothetical protein [Actinomadura atramentaria]|uniref:hypothetical protein n=1 Tax=Actinomadura atramentaria TaxID=1990 RepID=UPI0003A70102
MSELGRVLRQDARRTALLVAVPLLTVAGCLAAWPSLAPGVAYWENSSVALLNAARFVGPVAAALAAWAGVRERSLDFLRDLTTRSPATAALLDLLLLATAAVAVYAAVVAVVAVETLTRQDAGRPHPLGPLAGASAFVLHVVAGYLAGRVLPRAATPLLVLAATVPWALLRPPGGAWWSLLPPAAYDRVGLFDKLRTDVLADQALWALGLTAVLVLGYTARVDRRRALVPPLLAALLVTGVATVRLAEAGDRPLAPAPTGLACRQWPLVICVHPALRAALPQLTAAITPLAGRLTGTPAAFTRVEQRPADAPAGVAGGVAAIHLDETLDDGYAGRAASRILAEVTAVPCPSPRAAQYRSLVDAWLLGAVPPPIPDERTAVRFGAWTENLRRTWLRTHYAAYRDCDLGPGTFLPRAPAPRPPHGARPGSRGAREIGSGSLHRSEHGVRHRPETGLDTGPETGRGRPTPRRTTPAVPRRPVPPRDRAETPRPVVVTRWPHPPARPAPTASAAPDWADAGDEAQRRSTKYGATGRTDATSAANVLPQLQPSSSRTK